MYALVIVNKSKEISVVFQKLCEYFNDMYCFVSDNLTKILSTEDTVQGLEMIMFLQFVSLLQSPFQ